MQHLWPVLKSQGFSRLSELAKKATLDDLKMMVGRDATKLHFELEKQLLIEMNLFKLTDS
jgi:hypothetical protein